MVAQLCICAALPRVANLTPVVIVMPRRESLRTSNTARLAHLVLEHCQVLVTGGLLQPITPGQCSVAGRPARLLFPDPQAPVLGPEPITLVVPDGSWVEARHLAQRQPALATLPRVRLPEGLVTRYRLRCAPRPELVSTFEAIAHALGILEGEAQRDAMLPALSLMVERTLSTRSRGRSSPSE
jgi:DTW domain-containing protein YfiP